MRYSRDELVGLLSLLGGVALFSTIEITAKTIGSRVDPVVLTFIRFLTTGMLLLALATPEIRLRLRPLGWKDFRIFCLIGGIGIALAIPIFHLAILHLRKAASAAVIFSVNPVFALLFARFINREPWTLRKWSAAALGVLGVACFALESGQFQIASAQGLLWMLLSAALFALSICLAKKYIAAYGAMLLMGGAALCGSIMLLPLAGLTLWHTGVAGLQDAWRPVLYIALIGTALAYFLYYFGLLNTSVSRSSMTFFLKPVLASLLAMLLLGERFNLYMLTGTLLILSGLVLIVLTGRPDKRNAVLEE